jgi:hypothetical protein
MSYVVMPAIPLPFPPLRDLASEVAPAAQMAVTFPLELMTVLYRGIAGFKEQVGITG